MGKKPGDNVLIHIVHAAININIINFTSILPIVNAINIDTPNKINMQYKYFNNNIISILAPKKTKHKKKNMKITVRKSIVLFI